MIDRRNSLTGTGSGAVLALANPRLAFSSAGQVNFVSWGGTTQDAQEKAWGVPFSAESGIQVIQGGPSDYGKLKAMVDAGNVTPDVVDVENDFGSCRQGWAHGQARLLDEAGRRCIRTEAG